MSSPGRSCAVPITLTNKQTRTKPAGCERSAVNRLAPETNSLEAGSWKPRGAASAALRSVNVRRGAVEDFGRLHDGFRQRRVRMDGHRHVLGRGAHFDREHPLGDELARARAADAHAEHALGFRIDDELGDTVGAADRDGAAGGAPGKLRDRDLDAL